MVKFALHIHTTESDGELSPLETIVLALRKGFDMISISDHDTNLDMNYLDELVKRVGYSSHYLSDTARLIETPSNERLVVLKGNEITAIREKDERKALFSDQYVHLLGIGYQGELSSWKAVHYTMKEIKNKDGVVITPHPLAPFFRGIGRYNIEKYRDSIDALELNGLLVSFWKPFNYMTQKLAKKLDLPVICGADYHFKEVYFTGFYNLSYYSLKLLQRDPVKWLKDVLAKREYTPIVHYNTKLMEYIILKKAGKRFWKDRVVPKIKRSFKKVVRDCYPMRN